MSMKIAHRTLDCFEVFMREGRPLTLTELARALDAPMSSCFSLVKALRSRGFLYSLGPRRGFYPSRKMLDVMSVIAATDPVMDIFEPVLTELRDATRETVVLGKQQGDGVVYLAVIEGPRTIRFNSRAGEQASMHTSAIGKAILGELDDDALREAIAGLALKRMTRASLTNAKDLFAAVREGTRLGYHMTAGENVDDVMGIAACVVVGDEPFAIAIAGPISRMSEQRDDHARKLLKACKRITALQSRVLDGTSTDH
jgi:IclR family acetate operon transcriptional repressor